MHQSNPFVERVIQTIRRKAIKLLNFAQLSDTMFSYALKHATFLYNRTTHSALRTTPYNVIFADSHLDTLKNIPIFGSTVFFENGKFGIFIGVCTRSTTGTIIILPESLVPIRRNALSCRFDETFVSRHLFKNLKTKLSTEILTLEEDNTDDHEVYDDAIIDAGITDDQETGNDREDTTNTPTNDSSVQPERCTHTDDYSCLRCSTSTTSSHQLRRPYITRSGRKVQRYATVQGVSIDDTPDNLHDIPFTRAPEAWINATLQEVRTLRDFDTFDVVRRDELPPGTKTLPSRFVYVTKRSGKRKARLVAGGHRQFSTLFGSYHSSPTASQTTLKTFLTATIYQDLKLSSVDFKGAYLNAKLNEDVFLELPKAFDLVDPTLNGKTHLLRLKKSIYGLKQAGLLWYLLLREALEKLGFKVAESDPCLFISTDGNTYIMIYVDDCLLASKNLEMNKHIIEELKKQFELEETKLDDFLGFRIKQTPYSISVSAAHYITKILEESGMNDAHPVATPVQTNYDLTGVVTEAPYRTLLGKLLYISHMRPDISFAVHLLSTVAHKPTEGAFKMLKRVLRYLKGTQEKKLIFRKGPRELKLFVDASFADLERTNSTGSCFVYYGNCLLMHFARRQSQVATSTYESEMLEIVRGTKNGLYLRNILKEVGLIKNEAHAIYTDSKIAMDNILRNTLSNKSRHYVSKLAFVKEVLQKGIQMIYKIPGDQNIADIGTKPLTKDRHQHYVDILYDCEGDC